MVEVHFDVVNFGLEEQTDRITLNISLDRTPRMYCYYAVGEFLLGEHHFWGLDVANT